MPDQNPTEFEQAPACCRKSFERIFDIIESAESLAEMLAVAPVVSKPRARISPIGLLWALGSGLWSWRKNRKETSKMVDPIIQNRIKLVIDLEIVRHNNEVKLRDHWAQLRTELVK